MGRARVRTRLRFVDGEGSAIQLAPLQPGHGRARGRALRHVDEATAARAAGRASGHDPDRVSRAIELKKWRSVCSEVVNAICPTKMFRLIQPASLIRGGAASCSDVHAPVTRQSRRAH